MQNLMSRWFNWLKSFSQKVHASKTETKPTFGQIPNEHIPRSSNPRYTWSKDFDSILFDGKPLYTNLCVKRSDFEKVIKKIKRQKNA